MKDDCAFVLEGPEVETDNSPSTLCSLSSDVYLAAETAQIRLAGSDYS